jgi:hypothetical protein
MTTHDSRGPCPCRRFIRGVGTAPHAGHRKQPSDKLTLSSIPRAMSDKPMSDPPSPLNLASPQFPVDDAMFQRPLVARTATIPTIGAMNNRKGGVPQASAAVHKKFRKVNAPERSVNVLMSGREQASQSRRLLALYGRRGRRTWLGLSYRRC